MQVSIFQIWPGEECEEVCFDVNETLVLHARWKFSPSSRFGEIGKRIKIPKLLYLGASFLFNSEILFSEILFSSNKGCSQSHTVFLLFYLGKASGLLLTCVKLC